MKGCCPINLKICWQVKTEKGTFIFEKKPHRDILVMSLILKLRIIFSFFFSCVYPIELFLLIFCLSAALKVSPILKLSLLIFHRRTVFFDSDFNFRISVLDALLFGSSKIKYGCSQSNWAQRQDLSYITDVRSQTRRTFRKINQKTPFLIHSGCPKAVIDS